MIEGVIGMLVENEALYKSLEKTVSQMYCEVHAIYEPEAQLLMAIVSAQQLIYLNPDLLAYLCLDSRGSGVCGIIIGFSLFFCIPMEKYPFVCGKYG